VAATFTAERTLLLVDLVDSTALIGALGDRAAAGLFARFDRVVRDLLRTHDGR
jgi:class 3 adenylate cyclase